MRISYLHKCGTHLCSFRVVLNTTDTEVLAMVNPGEVRLHLTIFSYVLKWHYMSPVGGLTMQCLYPLAHYMFRVAEVLLWVVPVV